LVLKQALTKKIIQKNPAGEVRISIKDNNSIKKDILSSKEIQILYDTPCTNDQVKRAFLFSCFTGLRFSDVKALAWGNIDSINQSLSIVQQKTGVAVHLKLHESVILYILPKKGSVGGVRVFNLPSHTACLKGLRVWVKNAGIKKKITWHCSRHSLATNIVYYGGDLINSSSVIGHTSIKYTERYVHKAASLKDKAIDNLPGLINHSHSV